MRNKLSTIGRITTPAAMVVFMTMEITNSMTTEGWWRVVVLIGAALTAVGVEIVGILSGSTLEGFWRQGDAARAALSFVLLLIYTGAAVFILRHNPTILPVPVVAAVVYIISALSDSLVTAEARQETAERDAINYERQQEAIKEQRAHEERMEAKRLAAQVKIAEAQAKVTVRTNAGQNGRQFPSDWRQLSDSDKRELAGLPPEQLLEVADISERTAARWYDRLSVNGNGRVTNSGR